jgi:hypothetical protein
LPALPALEEAAEPPNAYVPPYLRPGYVARRRTGGDKNQQKETIQPTQATTGPGHERSERPSKTSPAEASAPASSTQESGRKPLALKPRTKPLEDESRRNKLFGEDGSARSDVRAALGDPAPMQQSGPNMNPGNQWATNQPHQQHPNQQQPVQQQPVQQFPANNGVLYPAMMPYQPMVYQQAMVFAVPGHGGFMVAPAAYGPYGGFPSQYNGAAGAPVAAAQTQVSAAPSASSSSALAPRTTVEELVQRFLSYKSDNTEKASLGKALKGLARQIHSLENKEEIDTILARTVHIMSLPKSDSKLANQGYVALAEGIFFLSLCKRGHH